jgi:nucleoside-diphosphate-sugar epimerase
MRQSPQESGAPVAFCIRLVHKRNVDHSQPGRHDISKEQLPDRIDSEEQLDDVLTRPTVALQQVIRTLPSPLLILGAGGKMGPTLAVMAKRAAKAVNHSLEVIAVSRFSDATLVARLSRRGVRTIACDLLDPVAVSRLPDASNLIYLVGLKFGTAKNPAATWAINTIVPTRVAERYYEARIVALSTGNVYPLSEVCRGGSLERNVLTPVGEYANSAVARERLFEFHSSAHRTSVALIRLFYAVELRYGILVDIARKVHNGAAIDLANGYFNCIWQADANEMVIRALALAASPPTIWNLCRPEVFSVREAATRFGELLERTPAFAGRESANALLGNSAALCSRLGTPAISLEAMQVWIAKWVRQGGRDLGKPTHFESRDGRY